MHAPHPPSCSRAAAAVVSRSVHVHTRKPHSSSSRRASAWDAGARHQQQGADLAQEAAAADVLVPPLVSYDPFPSAAAPARRVDVLLPPSYHEASACHTSYPVLYLQDGQNCTQPSASLSGMDWGLRDTALQLMQAGRVREFIAVLVWNTPQRLREYMPAGALRWLMDQQQCWYDRVEECYYNPTSDAFCSMLVEELKPFIDATYRTLPGREHTTIMGSSMGGLVSLYALQTHAEVFGAAACLSTHWLPGGGLPVAWLAAGNMPDPAGHRLYFDHGTAGLDAQYGSYQRQVDRLCLDAGYQQGVNYVSRVFEGADHNETAWRARLHVPLTFLFGVDAK